MQKAIGFNDATIVSIKGSDYRIHLWYMSKDDEINIIKKSDLKKSGLLWNKMSEETYYQRNREKKNK